MKGILGMIVVAAVGVGVWIGFDKYQKKESKLIEEQTQAVLQETRQSVAKSLAAGESLTALEEPPMLWQTNVVDLPHDAASSVILVSSRAPRDTGYWAYDRESQRVYIDCTHTDSAGKKWVDY